MNIGTIAAGKIIYLKKKNDDVLCIKPGKTLVNDSMYVAYDVKVGGVVIIPKGTRVLGDWVTEHTPHVAAQFQLTKIFLNRIEIDVIGDSDIVGTSAPYDSIDVRDADYFYRKSVIISSGGIRRRIIELGHTTLTLEDGQLDTVYVEINTEEVAVVLRNNLTV